MTVDEKGISKTAPGKSATVARRFRQVVAVGLLLAVLGPVTVAGISLVRGTWMLTPILSGSMRPGLPVGGLAFSERVPVDHLVVRDVIVFRAPNRASQQVVHRIVRLEKSETGQLLINTQGDANTVRDPWTLTIRGSYAYQVRWTIPVLGYAAVAYQNHRGYLLLGAGLVLIAIAASLVFGPAREWNRRTRTARQAPSDVTLDPSYDGKGIEWSGLAPAALAVPCETSSRTTVGRRRNMRMHRPSSPNP